MYVYSIRLPQYIKKIEEDIVLLIFMMYNNRLTLFRGCAFLKSIIVFSFSFFLLCSVSTTHSQEASGPILIQGSGKVPESLSNVMAQSAQTQQQILPQPVPQQTQPQTVPQQIQPQATPNRPLTRREMGQQVQEQKQIMQQSGQGENIPQVDKTATTGASASPQTAPAQTRTTPRPNGMISLNFDDADVYSVAQTVFGEILRVNYVIDQRVKGRVTFRSVAPVATDQVLPLMEVILRLNGIGVVEDNNLYRIVPIGDVAKEPAQVSIGRDPDKVPLQGKSIIHVVPLLYGSSSDMIKLVTPFLTTTAIVIDVPTMNNIILVDTDANVRRLLSLINLFDSEETRTKKPQVYVYHIQNSKAKDVAAILQQAFTATTVVMPASTTTTTVTAGTSTSTSTTPGSMTSPQPTRPTTQSTSTLPGTSSAAGAGGSLISPMTKIIADENLNLLVVLALPEDYEVIKEAVKKLDIIPRQVVIEGLIAEVSLTDDLSLGVSWALQYNPSVFKGFVGKTVGSMGFNVIDSKGNPLVTPQTTPPTAFGKSGNFSVLATVNNNFTAAINMLAAQSKAKLLAAPRILVQDNKEARIQVGQQIPIPTSATSTPTGVVGTGTTTAGNTTTTTIQYKDIGIILKVKPRINEGGLVSMELSQEISSFSTQNIAGITDSVVVNKTEATTNLVVQDGQTIMIGGLIREDVSDGKAGIPLLSKIPVLGYLFGQTDKTNHRNELIILLTPHVITNQAEAQAVTSSYVDTITETGKGKITREELIREQKPKAPDNGTSK
jgi:general secretion pathway protein D